MAEAFPPPMPAEVQATHWSACWQALGAAPPPGLLETLDTAWREPHRRYHDARHLGECLALWERWRAEAEHPAEVAIGLWFHDAVYETRRHDNEQLSADWARRCLADAGAPAAAGERIHALILATRHAAPAVGPDAELLVDIDLAVLGSPPERFEAYDRDVRAEYRWVPGFVYRKKRLEVLRGFVGRPRLYHGAAAAALLEAPARRNLAAAIARLER
jgi:predicted metal-dependent HD superfamily phosphohydrolase